MVFIEIVAVLFSFFAVFYSIRKNYIAWPIGLVGVIAYGVVFFNTQLYALMLLQVIFFLQGIYGWWYWTRKNVVTKETLPVISLHPAVVMFCILFIGITSTAFGSAVYSVTPLPFIYEDIFLAILSLVANQWLAKKVLESWILWIVADVGYIWLFVMTSSFISSGLYFAFLIMSIVGFIRWRKEKYETV